jgi:hypothetical protein
MLTHLREAAVCRRGFGNEAIAPVAGAQLTQTRMCVHMLVRFVRPVLMAIRKPFTSTMRVVGPHFRRAWVRSEDEDSEPAAEVRTSAEAHLHDGTVDAG